MTSVASVAIRRCLAGLAASGLLAGTVTAGEAVQFPGAKVVTFKDAECFDRKAEVDAKTLAGATREATTAACVTIKVGGAVHYVLPSAIKPPAGCTAARTSGAGPKATTYGANGASSCPGK